MATIEYTEKTLDKCDVTPTEIDSINVGTTIVITARSGFKFNTVSYPFIAWVDTDYSQRNTNTHSMYFNKTISDDMKTITLTSKQKFSKNVIIYRCDTDNSHPIEPDTPANPILTLNKNISGCTLSPDVSSVEIDGTSQILTVTPNSGYTFNDTPYLIYNDTEYNFIQSELNYIFDLNTLNITADNTADIYATATAVSVNPILTLNKNISGCTLSPDVSSVEIDGTSQIFTITADSNKDFKITPKITVNNTDTDFTLDDGIYTLDVNNLNITTNVNGIITATALSYKDVDIIATNCVISPNITRVYANDKLTLTATANSGYIFTLAPQINFNNRDDRRVNFTKITDYQYTVSITVTNDDLSAPQNHITITATAIAETPIIRKYGTIQVYKPTLSNMSDLATKRFTENGTIDGVTYNDIDLGQYITQFKRIFINVDSDSTGDIYLGRHNTEINAPIVNDDTITIDCGNVTLTGEYKNELDTKIYKIFIVLTCYGIIQLDSIYMNKTINVKYRCNIITGYADIIISYVADNTLIPIQQLRCKISQDLPYIINVEQLKNNIDDDVYNETPKIILQKQNIFNGNGYNTFKQDTIGNETGYFMIDRFVDHQINAPTNELDEIESLLKTGVIL